MKAVYMEAQGGPDVLKYGDVPDPAAGPGEIVVDVHAASVNAADWKRRRGGGILAPIEKYPYILGRDFSGCVGGLGADVADFQIGDAVFGVCAFGQEGTYAEKIAVRAAIVTRKPDSLSHVEAAAMALIGLTAVVSIEDTLKLQSGEKILIQGGAGGVAGFAIQLAKHIGAHVATTASANNHAYVRALGADEAVDYNTQDFTEVLSGFDAVFDTVGGAVTQQSFAVLKPGGRLATIAAGHEPPAPPRADLQSLRPQAKRDRRHLERIVELYESGAVRLPEIVRYPLREAAAAQRVSESRHLRGKLVLEVR
ncbi:MAG: NADP-dependent oxidoreductase [Rhodospirillales bacterium]